MEGVWKWAVESVKIYYAPLPNMGIGVGFVKGDGARVEGQVAVTVETDEDGLAKGLTRVWGKKVADAEGVLKEVAEGRGGKEENGWKLVFEHDWESGPAGAAAVVNATDVGGASGGVVSTQLATLPSTPQPAVARKGFMGALATLVNSRNGTAAAAAAKPSMQVAVPSATPVSRLPPLPRLRTQTVLVSRPGASGIDTSQSSLEESSLYIPDGYLLIQDDAEGSTRTVVAELALESGSEESQTSVNGGESVWVLWAEGVGRVEIDGWIVGREQELEGAKSGSGSGIGWNAEDGKEAAANEQRI